MFIYLIYKSIKVVLKIVLTCIEIAVIIIGDAIIGILNWILRKK